MQNAEMIELLKAVTSVPMKTHVAPKHHDAWIDMQGSLLEVLGDEVLEEVSALRTRRRGEEQEA